ncbi:MAG: lysine 2,3-aminomutase [Nitrosopumilaceae archaeon]|nr:lysine 2,3-aminomutase [Nitrosopumilaceae archaeon]NIU00862.1 lysine 2,3-aminomutase [Nitrosopumilaceae archaeon]NIU87315.1 lysine 2,3-aminomutase [Nitrosopumilaceae archaeon]NIV65843.1 lysine 2,3-aminomutase [Nitrosopumilaceae archaeon]NIX61464.1 lysine 2,3-aminomutase [Nitrosopumilaceae archaeon]
MTLQESVWSVSESPSIKSYTLANFRDLPQIQNLSEEEQFEMEVVGNVLPFKTNNYVVEQLIDWNNIPNDPMFVLTFPQKGMLRPKHFEQMAKTLKKGADKKEISEVANEIRLQLNPHPAGQLELNVPTLKDGTKLYGMQHKYKETCLFFPSQSQTCHAYCSFCFRWPQFVGMENMKFAMKEGDQLVQYLKEHPEISDVLFTGGDPMIMKAKMFRTYIDSLVDADISNLRTIRIGTKALAYWPYKFLTDNDAEETLETFQKVTDKGIHLAFMAHFNHVKELSTEAIKEAIKKVRATGAEIRTQSPLLSHINDNGDMWAEMWRQQVQLGCIPYYMFVVRDTGAQHYFGLSLVKAYEIFRQAYKQVSGLGRTVRGPSMSATPGKVAMDGISTINGKKVMVLRFLQGRNPDWVYKPFFAEYDENAIWLDDLKPAFDDKFFFEDELKEKFGTARKLEHE